MEKEIFFESFISTQMNRCKRLLNILSLNSNAYIHSKVTMSNCGVQITEKKKSLNIIFFYL